MYVIPFFLRSEVYLNMATVRSSVFPMLKDPSKNREKRRINVSGKCSGYKVTIVKQHNRNERFKYRQIIL